MYNMVSDFEIDGMRRKLLFLTNQQATDILHQTASAGEGTSSTQKTVRRLIDAFDFTQPRLVINLLRSQGTIFDTIGYCEHGNKKLGEYLGHGRVRGIHPWETHEDAIQAEKKLDTFMSEVLLPIALSQNAVVIAESLKGGCFLSDSFNRVMARNAARWKHLPQPPVTVINFSCDLEWLYHNPNPLANWRALKKKSNMWRARERPKSSASTFSNSMPSLVEMINEDEDFLEYGHADLDLDGINYIILDGINPTTKTWVNMFKHAKPAPPPIARSSIHGNKACTDTTRGCVLVCVCMKTIPVLRGTRPR